MWIGNNRGNRHSHDQDQHYHNFTIDDIVDYDQPAIINGVLQATLKKKLVYIGHSQGSTQLLLSLGVHKELKNKIASFIGIGPVLTLAGVDNPILNLLSKFYIIEIFKLLGLNKLLLF